MSSWIWSSVSAFPAHLVHAPSVRLRLMMVQVSGSASEQLTAWGPTRHGAHRLHGTSRQNVSRHNSTPAFGPLKVHGATISGHPGPI